MNYLSSLLSAIALMIMSTGSLSAQTSTILKLGYQQEWTARYIFNSEGGYAGNFTNIESTIHGWEKLYQAQDGDIYTILTNDSKTRVQFKTPINIYASHRYTVSMAVLADKSLATVEFSLQETDNENVRISLSNASLNAGREITIRKQGLTGTEIQDLVLEMNIGNGTAGTEIRIRNLSIFDSTAGEELWTGTSYYNYCYSGTQWQRQPDPTIEGRQETLSWTQADFDDSQWAEMPMPVGNQGYIQEVRTIWPGGDTSNYWIRRDFELKEIHPTSRYNLLVCHDDAYTIYVNGHAIHSDLGWTNGKSHISVEIPSRFLKVGRNVIATYIQQNWGGKFYDCGMSETLYVYEEGDLDADISSSLIATEVEVSNIDQVLDYSFNYGSWLELYNKSDKRISLDYLYISDDSLQLDKFKLPKYGVMAPHSYRCIFFGHNSANGTFGPDANRQVPFKLQTEGGTIYLSEDGKTPFLTVSYPADITRCSWARKGLTSEEWGYNGEPTPAARNSDSFANERLAVPVIDTDSRLFKDEFPFSVQIPEGATLYFTTDGTTPTPSNGLLSRSGSFYVSSTCCYRFRLYQNGYLPSPVVTRSFIYRDRDYYLPVMSITTKEDNLYGDSIGIYVDGVNGVEGRNHGRSNINMDWERPVNVEYITPDGRMTLNQEAEMCISGGWSRHYAPASFKIKATKLYEGMNSLDYPFFHGNPYKKYKQLLIRNGGNDNDSPSHGRVRDAITQEVLTSNGFYVDAQQYQPIHVFFNGKYIGMLNMREPNNKYNGTASYGYDDDLMDAFEYSNGYFQMAGTKDAFLEWNRLSQNAQDAETYEKIKQLVDIDEVINYFAAITYIGCTDWICNNNNSKGYRSLPDGRFHLTVLDQDWGWGNQQALSSLSSYNGNELAQIFNGMRKNKDFQRQFVDAYCLLGGSVFTPERCEAIGDSICNLVEKALSFEGRAPWTSFNEQKYNMTSENTRDQRHTALRKVFGLGQGMKAEFHSNIPQASFMLNNLPVPGDAFNGTLYAPVTITASAPAGYVFDGWTAKEPTGSVAKELFPRSSQWQYWDEGSLDSYSWQAPECSFSGWKSGTAPLGYGGRGDLPVTTMASYHSSYYLRKSFTLAEEPKADDTFKMELSVDDGYVLYVNGIEVQRYLMPEGEITYETMAVTHAPDPYYRTQTQIPSSLLHKGENVIAVRIHNNVITSSDIFWAASLTLTSEGSNVISTDRQLVLTENKDFSLTAVFHRAVEEAPVRINEVSAANDIYVSDYYKRSDWLELYNTTDKEIDLTGMYLSDNAMTPEKYQIMPADGVSAIIPPHATKLVWADKKEGISQLHAPFKLENADGAVLTLQAADGSWRDVMYYNQHDGKGSYGRYPNGGGSAFQMSIPTIDRDNILATYDFILSDIAREEHPVATTFALRKGWNWSSHNLRESFSTELFHTDNSIIRSQREETYRDSILGWVGNLAAIRPAVGYKIHAQREHEITLTGFPYDTDMPVAVQKGWNWIGCPLSKATVLNQAFSGYQATEGDRIVGFDGFAIYEDGQWNGSLKTVEPSQAYMLCCAQQQSFCWNALTKETRHSRQYRAVEEDAEEEALRYGFYPHSYPEVMNIVATVISEEQTQSLEGCLVMAEAGGKCRALGTMADGKAYLTIHGEGEEELSFTIVDGSGMEYPAQEKLCFNSLSLKGNSSQPYELHISDSADVLKATDYGTILTEKYYNLAGQRVQNPCNGVCIKRTFYKDGKIISKKLLR